MGKSALRINNRVGLEMNQDLALIQSLMLMPMLPMHMLVLDFFSRRGAHGDHLEGKAQRLAA